MTKCTIAKAKDTYLDCTGKKRVKDDAMVIHFHGDGYVKSFAAPLQWIRDKKRGFLDLKYFDYDKAFELLYKLIICSFDLEAADQHIDFVPFAFAKQSDIYEPVYVIDDNFEIVDEIITDELKYRIAGYNKPVEISNDLQAAFEMITKKINSEIDDSNK